MSGAIFDRETARLLVVAWVLVVAGAAALLWGYSGLPEAVVLYRPPWSDAPTMGPRSALSVGRIAAMGIGQLGAATAMVFAARGADTWARFWRWLGLVAGVKTLLECVAFLMPQGSTLERALSSSTVAVVGLFVLSAARWWRRGELRSHPTPTRGPRIWLGASLALWGLSAVAPRFLA